MVTGIRHVIFVVVVGHLEGGDKTIDGVNVLELPRYSCMSAC